MLPRRFTLRVLVGLVTVSAICVAGYAYFALRPLPVTKISCTQPWSDVTSRDSVVAFVDAEFNGFTLIYSDTFESFCRWFRSEFGSNALHIDTTLGRGETWNKLQETWSDRDVLTGSYKTFGGAGQVIWIHNGTIVDTAFLPDSDFDTLKQLTIEHFH